MSKETKNETIPMPIMENPISVRNSGEARTSGIINAAGTKGNGPSNGNGTGEGAKNNVLKIIKRILFIVIDRDRRLITIISIQNAGNKIKTPYNKSNAIPNIVLTMVRTGCAGSSPHPGALNLNR